MSGVSSFALDDGAVDLVEPGRVHRRVDHDRVRKRLGESAAVQPRWEEPLSTTQYIRRAVA